MVPQAAEHATMHRIMLELETTLDAVDTFSLLDAMNQLKSALERVALDRTDAGEMASIVRNQAVNIAAMLRTHHADLTRLLENNIWELENSMENANNLIRRIVDFNAAITKEYILDAGRIVRGQGVSEYGPLEMLDQRNLLIDQLAEFANIEVFQNNNGSVRIVMGGVTVIDDQDFLQIRMQDFSDFNAAVMSFSNGVGFAPSTGELKAYMEMVNGNGPYASGMHQTATFGIPYYINALNVFAQGFAEIMNDVMNASLRASGFSYPGADGRADNSNWERNLIWAGWEYMFNEDGTHATDPVTGERIRRQELVQARDTAGRLMIHDSDGMVESYDATGRFLGMISVSEGDPVMIWSFMKAEVNASNILVSNEWLDDPLMIGMTFDPMIGDLVQVRVNGLPQTHQGQYEIPAMRQGTQQALRQATNADGSLRWHAFDSSDPANPIFGIPTAYDPVSGAPTAWERQDPNDPTSPIVVVTGNNRIPIMIPAFQRNAAGHYVNSQGNAIPAPPSVNGGVPIMTNAFSRNIHGQYVDADGNTLGTLANGSVVNGYARVPVFNTFMFERNSSGRYIDADGNVLLNQTPVVRREDDPLNPGEFIYYDANNNVVDITGRQQVMIAARLVEIDGVLTPVQVSGGAAAAWQDADGNIIRANVGQAALMWEALPGAPDAIEEIDRTTGLGTGRWFVLATRSQVTDATPAELAALGIEVNADGEPIAFEVPHMMRTGGWRQADLDGTNLQRFIRELESDRSWGNVLDFNGCAFGKLQFISNRLAQGIEYTSHEFDMAMATVQVLLDNRDAVSGVCETEEGIHMLKYQRWFNASARLMTTMDEALDTIINRMGRVGL
jgi:flagellar hook-associated protein FlgK